MFVFLALLEYAVILYMKNMSGVRRQVFKAGVLVITPSKDADKDCWINQQTQAREEKIKKLDFACMVLFPFMFMTFNIIYWSMTYSITFRQSRQLAEE